jgi:hypothetical protein
MTLIAKRESRVQKNLGRLLAYFQHLIAGKFLKGGACLTHSRKVFANNASVDLADSCQRFTRATVTDLSGI